MSATNQPDEGKLYKNCVLGSHILHYHGYESQSATRMTQADLETGLGLLMPMGICPSAIRQSQMSS
jgi:hypothetical protein